MKYSGTDIALLLVRVGLGVIFLSHGLNNFLDGSHFIGIVEFLSGLAVLVGFGVSWAGILMAADMLGSVTLAKVSNGFGSWDLELVLFLCAIALAFAGPGHHVMFGRHHSKKA